MSHLFFVTDGQPGAEPRVAWNDSIRWVHWRPTWKQCVPRGFPLKPFAAWWLLHYLRVFANRDYGLLAAYDGETVVHRTCVFPPYFRFPFMAKDDLQFGDIWTAEAYRGRGLARLGVAKALQEHTRTGRRFWYVTDEGNRASIRVAERAGFSLHGRGHRARRLGIRLLGSFVVDAPEPTP